MEKKQSERGTRLATDAKRKKKSPLLGYSEDKMFASEKIWISVMYV